MPLPRVCRVDIRPRGKPVISAPLRLRTLNVAEQRKMVSLHHPRLRYAPPKGEGHYRANLEWIPYGTKPR
jgi:hypothetical protein